MAKLKKIDVETLVGLRVFSTAKYKKGALECHLSLWLCLCHTPEWLDQFYSYLVSNSLPTIGWVPLNINILVPKMWAFHMGPNKHNSDFLKNCYDDFY